MSYPIAIHDCNLKNKHTNAQDSFTIIIPKELENSSPIFVINIYYPQTMLGNLSIQLTYKIKIFYHIYRKAGPA